MKARNVASAVALIAGFLLGGAGVVLAGTDLRATGAVLLGVAFMLNLIAIGLALINTREQRKRDESDLAVVRRLVREGTLYQYLRDVDGESRTDSAPPRELCSHPGNPI